MLRRPRKTERKRPAHLSRQAWAAIKLQARGHRVHGVLLEPGGQARTVERQYRISQRNMARIQRSYDEHPGPYLGDGRYLERPPA